MEFEGNKKSGDLQVEGQPKPPQDSIPPVLSKLAFDGQGEIVDSIALLLEENEFVCNMALVYCNVARNRELLAQHGYTDLDAVVKKFDNVLPERCPPKFQHLQRVVMVWLRRGVTQFEATLKTVPDILKRRDMANEFIDALEQVLGAVKSEYNTPEEFYARFGAKDDNDLFDLIMMSALARPCRGYLDKKGDVVQIYPERRM